LIIKTQRKINKNAKPYNKIEEVLLFLQEAEEQTCLFSFQVFEPFRL